MRTLALSLLFATSAFAQSTPSSDVTACIFPLCGGLQDAIVQVLADQGLGKVDGLAYSEGRDGQGWLTVVSTDARGLDRIDPTGGTRVTPIEGTISYSRTVPFSADDLLPNVGQVPLATDHLLEIEGLKGDVGDGGGGGGGSCTQVCICTETGYECWTEC